MKIEQMSDKLIKYEVGTSVTVDHMRELVKILEEKLKQQQTFGIIIIRNGDHQKNPEATKWFNGWLKKNKPLLKQYCVGVAMVTNSDRLLKLYKPLAGMMISKMFGCSGEMFTNESDAITWMLGKMRNR